MSKLNKQTKDSVELGELLSPPLAEQQERGYADTLREILQQPATWAATADLLCSPQLREQLQAALTPPPSHIVLTGSGSSMYIGECLAPTLQLGLGITTQAIAAGSLLTHWRSVLPPGTGLLISLARSGDSPESCGVVNRLLADAPDYRHLVITCNAHGKLATSYRDDPRVTVLVLDERTNDRSLVMTSSFTNLLLAGAGLVRHEGRDAIAAVNQLARSVQRVFDEQADALAAVARGEFSNVVYLGSGGALGAAHESALKMLEMSGGAVVTMAETYLGLRHGPMSSLDEQTLVVGFLSPDPAVRAYELDLLRELSRKQLGMTRVLVGEHIPDDVLGLHDVAVELAGLGAMDDALPLLADVAVGQLLAFFRCLELGGKPDTPSQGVLTRVVEHFPMHSERSSKNGHGEGA
ncbi:tagatose-6-phosphate ketose isomerase [Rhodanobacter sp. C01]|uniref:SIS domain-containing protein n=1 Tax=Rhodanobacter sp. C01 TaxID=1945856 RepID=UPI0020C2A27E|nr:tagatose-6-phosphate ketose isomerase [Rhodanobacter sp. C01]